MIAPLPYTDEAGKAFAEAMTVAGLTGAQMEACTRELHARGYTIRRWPLWATIRLVWEDRRGVWAACRAGARTWGKGNTR